MSGRKRAKFWSNLLLPAPAHSTGKPVAEAQPTNPYYEDLPADTPLIRHRHFFARHHTISNGGLVGGGQMSKPDETSLDDGDVSFLAEFPKLKMS